MQVTPIRLSVNKCLLKLKEKGFANVQGNVAVVTTACFTAVHTSGMFSKWYPLWLFNSQTVCEYSGIITVTGTFISTFGDTHGYTYTTPAIL